MHVYIYIYFQTLPLGVPRFKKIPNDYAMERSSYSLETIPKFQSLPNSTSKKFETLTKVETFAIDSENVSDIDLKGHTIEELADVANVSKEIIMSAIKIRRQQMLVEKKNQKTIPSEKVISSTTMKPIKISIFPEISTESSVDTSIKTTLPATLKYVTKKKLKKHNLNKNHKVFICNFLVFYLNLNLIIVLGDECS